MNKVQADSKNRFYKECFGAWGFMGFIHGDKKKWCVDQIEQVFRWDNSYRDFENF